MWNTLTEDNWLLAINELNLPLFYQPNYLNSIAIVYQLKVNYLSFETKYQTIALIAFLSQTNKNVVLPEGFSYSPFYIKNDINEKTYVDILHSFIAILKKDFRSVKLKLSISITDIRPFIWEGFNVEVKYTHIKANDLAPDANIIKNLGKQIIEEYKFKVEELSDENLSINLEFLKTLNFSEKKLKQHQKLIKLWNNSGYIKVFSIYKDSTLVCSNLVFLDFKSSNAYTILLNQVDAVHKYAHTYLYDNMIKWGKKNQINTIDFCGANFKSISEFKSRFNTELKMYFMVNYYPFQANSKLGKIYSRFKQVLIG